MAATQDGKPDAPKPTGSARADARLARQAEALRENLRRRKAQRRGRADAGRDEAPDAD